MLRIILLAQSLLFATAAPLAAQTCDQACVNNLVRDGTIRPLDQIVPAAINAAGGGKFLDAQLTKNSNGAWIYVVKVLGTGNQVQIVRADAASGAIQR